MNTPWFFPNLITQFAEVEQHVPWTGEQDGYNALKNSQYTFIGTTRPLLHIANPSVNDLKMKTHYLFLSDFRIATVPDVISQIEVELIMKRAGRITDETIQLRYQDNFIGYNRGDADLSNAKTIIGDVEYWGISEFSSEILRDNSFGIGIRFQSHPSWPHSDSPLINYIRIRVQ
jgi:hypothetical protein